MVVSCASPDGRLGMHKSSRHRRNTARGMERTRRLRLHLQPNACVRGQQLPENGVTHAAWLYRPLKERASVSAPLKERASVSAQRTHHAVIENGSRAQGSSTRPLRRDAERRHACGKRTTRQHTNVGTVMLSVLPYRPRPPRGGGERLACRQ